MTKLERFSQLGEIEISQDPLSGFRRLAVLQDGQKWFPVAQQAILDLTIHYLDSNGNRLNQIRLRSYEKRLMADMNGKINAQFGYLEKPGEESSQEYIDEYNNAPTEYQVILALSLTTPVPQLCIQFIELRDSQGYFDI